MVNKVCVLFHNPKHDKAGRLNQCLESKGALVNHENKVATVKFPDGWLIVCYDEEPGEQVKQVVREKTNEVQPPPQQILIVHKTSWDMDPDLNRAQQELTSKGTVLSKAGRIRFYSHEIGDPIYESLIKLLTHSLLEELSEALEKSEKKTLAGDFSRLKHSIGCILSALDIDLQGLVASDFNAEYKREVAAAYQAELKTQSVGIMRQVEGATYAGQRDDIMSVGAVVPAPGKAIGFLEQARAMIHSDSFSIKKLKEEALRSTGDNTELARDINLKWSDVEKLLPEAGRKPDAIYNILRHIETEEGLDQLESQFGPSSAYDKIFHEWFYLLDEALDRLRDTMTATLGKTSGAKQQ